MSARRRYCCPTHGGKDGAAFQALEQEGDFYVIPIARGWFNALVKRVGSLDVQEFQSEAQAIAWAEGHPLPTLF